MIQHINTKYMNKTINNTRCEHYTENLYIQTADVAVLYTGGD